MAKVRKFSTESKTAQKAVKPDAAVTPNLIPEIPNDVVQQVIADAPVTIKRGRGNPRIKRYTNKTFSMLPEDDEAIGELLKQIRKNGLYERGRSDIVRAGVKLLSELSLEELLRAVDSVTDLKK